MELSATVVGEQVRGVFPRRNEHLTYSVAGASNSGGLLTSPLESVSHAFSLELGPSRISFCLQN